MFLRLTSAVAVVLVAAAAFPAPRSPDIHGEWVRYASAGGDSVLAYVAYPERPDPGPAVIVTHEIFGMSDWVRSVADSLAVAGFVAIAPDLLSRHGGTAAQSDVRQAIRDLPPDSITADLDATYAYVRTLKAVRADAVGVIGFCWGGSQSFRYATNNANLKAAVVCYGSGPDAADIARIRAPVFGLYGENDARITAAVPEVAKAMDAAGKKYLHSVYPGTGHGFLRTREPADVTAGAWKDVLGFLEKEVGR